MKTIEAGLRTADSVLSPPHSVLSPQSVLIRFFGLVEYQPTWDAMRRFTAERTTDTRDEIWLVQHPPVYTQGLAGKPEHLLHRTHIPVIKIDRGGQITYHGPGQVIAYVLIDLRRRGWGVKQLVAALEQSVIDLLETYSIHGERRTGAPGVYVDGRKIAQVGLRVRRGASYHGLSLNAAMDLEPFRHIKPCGYAGLETTDVATLLGNERAQFADIKAALLGPLLVNLGYNDARQ